MKSKIIQIKRLLRDIHTDENGAGTVEWMLLVTVALVVLVAIYYFVRWAMKGTADAAKAVEGEY